MGVGVGVSVGVGVGVGVWGGSSRFSLLKMYEEKNSRR